MATTKIPASMLSSDITSSITAGTTQTQSGATALTGIVNNVDTCANKFDGVKLPAAAEGSICTVINTGAQPLLMYPATGDALMHLAANTVFPGVLLPNHEATWFAVDATTWILQGLKPGDRVLLDRQSLSGTSVAFGNAAMNDDTFDLIEVEGSNIEFGTNAVNFQMQFSSDLGVTPISAGNYSHVGNGSGHTGSANNFGSLSATAFVLANSVTDDGTYNLMFDIKIAMNNFANTQLSQYKGSCTFLQRAGPPQNRVSFAIAGIYESGTAGYNGLVFSPSSGSFDHGKINVSGIWKGE